MPENATPAMRARGRKLMDGAFEAIEIVRNAVDDNLQRLVVFVSANFASDATVTILIALRQPLSLTVLPKILRLTLNHPVT